MSVSPSSQQLRNAAEPRRKSRRSEEIAERTGRGADGNHDSNLVRAIPPSSAFSDIAALPLLF